MLLKNTAEILRCNQELSQRLANLEGRIGSSQSVITTRPASRATHGIEHPPNGFGILNSSTRIPDDESRAFQFEGILKASRVYRRARRDSTDCSFRSSIPQSHAWTALSDISLSDISVISVIALPLQRNDITNQQRYDFTELAIGSDNNNSTEVSHLTIRGGNSAHLYPSLQIAQTLDPNSTHQAESPSRTTTANVRSDYVMIYVYGSPEADINGTIARV